jgi:HAD superfamily hydrolase (TIGR01484 family)
MTAPLARCPRERLAAVRVLFTDLDDTLTTGGMLGAEALAALGRAADRGLPVFIVTGGPAGAAETLARLLPVSGAVGESGAIWFWRDRSRGAGGAMRVGRALGDAELQEARARRARALARIRAEVPGARAAHDQSLRDADLAIELAPEGKRLPEAEVARVEAICAAEGLTTGRSSIHVNAWTPRYDKITGARAVLQEALGLALDALAAAGAAAYVGDALNDAGAFAYFPLSVGVANVAPLLEQLPVPPAWVTQAACGAGFAELVEAILAVNRAGGG